jgi:SAM-dependent methyltransferase
METQTVIKFFEQLKLEIEDIQTDLLGINLVEREIRIGDFGCGWGITTLGLMTETNTSDCIGVDQFLKNQILNVPSIQDVQQLFNSVKDFVASHVTNSQSDFLQEAILHKIKDGKLPNFQTGDIITGIGIPSNLDFVYCKKVLKNISDGGYGHDIKGVLGITSAIENIAKSIRPGGLVCIIEPAGVNFIPFIEHAGLDLIRCCRINRGDISQGKRLSLYKSQYMIYQFAKPL